MNYRVFLALAAAITAPIALMYCAAIPSSLENEERAELLFESGVQVKVPDGDGPFPTILLFHGCGGLFTEEGEPKSIINNYAEIARDHGVAAIIVDSLSPRNIDYKSSLRQVCSGLRLRGRDRARDVEAALSYVRADPALFDQDNLALAGWSHGAWSVMELLVMSTEDDEMESDEEETSPLEGVKAVHLTYPYCGFLTRAHEHPWGEGLNIRMVLATDDTLSNNPQCIAALEQARVVNDDTNVSCVEFDGQTHAFDEEEHAKGSKLAYNADAAALAHEQFGEWLDTVAFSTDSRPADISCTVKDEEEKDDASAE